MKAVAQLISALLLLNVQQLSAQPRELEVAAGLAIPIEALGQFRGAGPFVRYGVVFGEGERWVMLRTDAEVMLMPGQRAPVGTSEKYGDIRSAGAMLSFLIGPLQHRIAPYVVLGLGAHYFGVAGSTQRAQMSPGVRGGVGLRVSTARYRFSAELGSHLNFSDRGTGRDYAFGSYVPFVFGLTY